MFAYWLYPTVFVEGEGRACNVLNLVTGTNKASTESASAEEHADALPAEPDAGTVRVVGLDVVLVLPPHDRHVFQFGCSPLSCNGLCYEHAVNNRCLLDEYDDAVRLAREFSMPDTAEPGVYAIVKVGEVVDPA